jgi:HEAT repeat protein
MVIRLAGLLCVLTLPAAAASTMPLPGYSGDAFPPERLLPPAEDPLEGLAAEAAGEELRDAVAAAPSALWLQAGLRAPRPAERVSAVLASAVPHNIHAVPHLRGVLLRLDEAPEVRAAAAVALGRIGEGTGLRGLMEGLKDPAPEVRVAAALALGQLKGDGAVTALGRALGSDSSWWVRHAAAIALGRAKRAYGVGALETAVTSEPRWQVRLQAVKSLQEIGTPRAAEAASLALTDPDSGVRAAAGQAVAAIGAEREAVALSSALKVETDPSTRAVLQSAFRTLLSRY